MSGYHGNIEDLTLDNGFFRKVLFTGPNSQLVVMSLKPGEDIGEEVHEEDQFFRFEDGWGKVVLGETEEYEVKDGDAVVVPAGLKHNIINISENEELKLYTIYSPAHHPEGTVHETKEIAMEEEDH
jgi:mannose-6-phosphate isomerase-like protein (cupin superfamily)